MRAIKKIKYVLGLCNRKGCLSKAIVDIKIDGDNTSYKGCLCEKHYDEFLKAEIKKTAHEGSVQEQQKIKIKIDGKLLSNSLANYLTNCDKV